MNNHGELVFVFIVLACIAIGLTEIVINHHNGVTTARLECIVKTKEFQKCESAFK